MRARPKRCPLCREVIIHQYVPYFEKGCFCHVLPGEECMCGHCIYQRNLKHPVRLVPRPYLLPHTSEMSIISPLYATIFSIVLHLLYRYCSCETEIPYNVLHQLAEPDPDRLFLFVSAILTEAPTIWQGTEQYDMSLLRADSPVLARVYTLIEPLQP